MSRKRLALVANRFHPQLGGAELNTYFQSIELSRFFSVDVITPIRDRDPRREKTSGVRIFRVHDLYNPLNRFPSLGSETLCPSVFGKILTGGYDVIHCFPALNRNNLLALTAARLRGIPAFLSNFDLFNYTELLESSSSIDFEKLSLTKRQKKHLGRFDAIFTISERETRLIREANENVFLSTVPIKIEEYEDRVDEPAFRRKYGIPSDAQIVLCLSRVSRVKGQDVLLKAVPLLREKLDRFVVLYVGRTDYEPDYYAEMQDFVERERLEDHVIFAGGVPREDALAALRLCAVHVLPMRFMNSGAVVVETWASERPVIQSTRIDPNYVKEGENGLTFKIEDPDDLVEKIAHLLREPELCRRMGEAGRKLVEQRFLYPHLIDQYLRTYETYGGSKVRGVA